MKDNDIQEIIIKTLKVEHLLNAIISFSYFGHLDYNFTLEVLNDENFNNGLRIKIFCKIFSIKESESISKNLHTLFSIRNALVHNPGVLKGFDGKEWRLVNLKTYKRGDDLKFQDYDQGQILFNEIYNLIRVDLDQRLKELGHNPIE
jgi:hypothetical protein